MEHSEDEYTKADYLVAKLKGELETYTWVAHPTKDKVAYRVRVVPGYEFLIPGTRVLYKKPETFEEWKARMQAQELKDALGVYAFMLDSNKA